MEKVALQPCLDQQIKFDETTPERQMTFLENSDSGVSWKGPGKRRWWQNGEVGMDERKS